MKKGNLGKLAIIGAGLYAAKVLTDKSDEEKALNNLFAGLPQTATAEIGEIPFSPDQFKKWLDANPSLKAALRSGVTAEQVIQNINNNVYQLDNVQLQSIRNSIIEFLNVENGLLYPTTSFTSDIILGKQTISIDESITITLPKIDLGRIYCIEGYFKTSTSQEIYIFAKGALGENVNAFNGINYKVVATGINADYTRKRLYFSFSGTISEFKTLQLVIFKGTGTFKVSNLTFNEVSLGEAVPVNLPFLPKGQEVIDPTTGDRGILTNEIVDWYTMA